jgi:hypothetical protein
MNGSQMSRPRNRLVKHLEDVTDKKVKKKPKTLVGVNPKDKLGLQKVPLRYIVPAGMIYQSIAHHLGSEVKGYEPYNWRDPKKPVRYSVYLEAMMRHLLLLMDGEDLDEESLGPHEASIMAGCSIVLDARLNGTLIDDRYKTGKVNKLMKEVQQTLIKQKELYKKKKKTK